MNGRSPFHLISQGFIASASYALHLEGHLVVKKGTTSMISTVFLRTMTQIVSELGILE